MTYEELLPVVKELLATNFGLDEDCINEDDLIIIDLQLDSMDCVDFLCAFEAYYGIEIDDEKYQKEFYEACKGSIRDLTTLLVKMYNEGQVEHE